MHSTGFSLIELLVVIVIMGILATMGTLNFNSWQQKVQIERQTRELFADLNQARVDSIHRKQRHSIIMQPSSYTFRRYSSENENRSSAIVDQTLVQTRNVSYQISKGDGSTVVNEITEFDIRGFTNDNGTFRINPVGTEAHFDCIIIAIGRTNMGKMENGTCIPK